MIDDLANRVNSKEAQKLHGRIAEVLESDKIKTIQSEYDKDAKVGHKSEDTDFFGYKNHLAMNDERLITAIEVTPGHASNTKEFKNLVETSVKNGMELEEVLGDMAYSSKDNLDYCEGQGRCISPHLWPI